MEDLIALNKELSALIAELGGTPFSISIVDGRVVLPEELVAQQAAKSQSDENPPTNCNSEEQNECNTVVEATEESPAISEEQQSGSAQLKIETAELNLDSKDQENSSDALISEKPSAPSDSSPTQEKDSLAASSKSSIEENSSSKESAEQTKIAETLNSSPETSNRFGFVTLATTDDYASGALVLARSLRTAAVKTSADLVCLISNDLNATVRAEIVKAFDEVIVVDVINSNDDAMLALLKRPELGVTLTKLHCWKLTQYSKMVFLDADTLVVKNIDDLFERDELSAVADCGWPSCFNSGVFVFKPSLDTFTNLMDFAKSQGSFDGGDQGLLNDFFSDWSTASTSKILPFGYNVHAAATYAYAPAFNKFKHQVKVVHFLGAVKPWSSRTAPQEEFAQYWQLWWSFADVSSQLDVSNGETKGNQAGLVEAQSDKSGFEIVQDALDAQMSAQSSEPPPKFDIKL